MLFRIPNEFLFHVEEREELNFIASEYRCNKVEEEDPFEEADEEYIIENIEE